MYGRPHDVLLPSASKAIFTRASLTTFAETSSVKTSIYFFSTHVMFAEAYILAVVPLERKPGLKFVASLFVSPEDSIFLATILPARSMCLQVVVLQP